MRESPEIRALVTGASGFLGQPLVSRLSGLGMQVVQVLGRRGHARSSAAGLVESRAGDLADSTFVREVLYSAKPTYVFHLAGTRGGQEGGLSAYQTQLSGNVDPTVQLLEGIVALSLNSIVVVTSSSAVYGNPASLPIDESAPFRPVSPYGAAKVSQEMAALQYHLSLGTRVIRVRPFNLVGPGQPADLLLSDLSKQVAIAEREGMKTLAVGNLSSRRDYVDVRDAVEALTAVAFNGRPGDVYNVASGRSFSGEHCLDRLVRLSRVKLTVTQEEARLRPHDIPDQVGSYRKILSETGWEPRIDLNTSISDLLDYWRASVSAAEGP